jgi:preprotein translocase subunit SecD
MCVTHYNTYQLTYVVALNLAPSVPSWLAGLGGKAMSLGLDLRGGVHFLLEVDTNLNQKY